MSDELTQRDVDWLIALARARIKKQERRINGYERHHGDDTEHFDILCVNLTWMEDAVVRLEQALSSKISQNLDLVRHRR